MLELLHRDEQIIVVDKPSGLLTHRGWGRDEEVAVTLARQASGAFVYPVHRLDRGASGVLLFALTSEAAAAMQALFEEGRVAKRYLAAVRGVAPEAVRVDHAIPRREDGPRVPAVTDVHRLSTAGGYSLVEAHPLSGRLHQVRRHLKHISHPILGDANYGKGDINRRLRAEVGLDRLALHAAEIRFIHPFSGAEISVTAPLPDDLAAPLRRLGLVSD